MYVFGVIEWQSVHLPELEMGKVTLLACFSGAGSLLNVIFAGIQPSLGFFYQTATEIDLIFLAVIK